MNAVSTGKWRYIVAGVLVLTAGVLGYLSYLSKPTASILTEQGNAALDRMIWLALGTIACTIAAMLSATYETLRRQNMRAKAVSPIDRDAYIQLLQSMIKRAQAKPRHPVDTNDIAQLTKLVQPAIATDATSRHRPRG